MAAPPVCHFFAKASALIHRALGDALLSGRRAETAVAVA